MSTKNKEIENAITVVQLRKDRETLVQRSQRILGAINYIDGKIAELSKPPVNELKKEG